MRDIIMTRLHQLALNKDGFAFDPTTGESFSLNRTGLFLLEQLIDERSPEEAAEALAEKFEVSREEAERDVSDFIDHLRAYRLV